LFATLILGLRPKLSYPAPSGLFAFHFIGLTRCLRSFNTSFRLSLDRPRSRSYILASDRQGSHRSRKTLYHSDGIASSPCGLAV
jgi:hypothetical protein